MGEYVRIFTLHQLDVVVSQFKRSSLEIHIAWTARQHETKINVNYMP